MSLLWIEGFENFETTIGNNIQTPLSLKYVSSTTSMTVGNGRHGGYSLVGGTGQNFITPNFGSYKTTMIIGFAVNIVNTSAITLARFYRDQTNVSEIQRRPTGQLRYLHGATNYTSSGRKFTLLQNSWNYIEIKVFFNTSGTVQIKLNGNIVLSSSGNFGTQGVNAVQFLASGSVMFDDIYVCDGTGSKNNNFLNDSYVTGITPNSDGSNSSWIPSSGINHFSLINEIPVSANDTSYLETDVIGNKDTFVYESFTDAASVEVATFSGLQVNTIGRRFDLGTKEIKNIVSSSGTDAEGESQFLSGGYENIYDIFETTPDTGSSWDKSSINSAEYGFKLEV